MRSRSGTSFACRVQIHVVLILIVYARRRVMYPHRRASLLGAGGEVWTASTWRRRAFRCGRDVAKVGFTMTAESVWASRF